MFKCMVTGRMSQSGEKPLRVVIKSRSKEYFDVDNQLIGKGWEIEKEMIVLVAGKILWDSWTEEVKNKFMLTR